MEKMKTTIKETNKISNENLFIPDKFLDGTIPLSDENLRCMIQRLCFYQRYDGIIDEFMGNLYFHGYENIFNKDVSTAINYYLDSCIKGNPVAAEKLIILFYKNILTEEHISQDFVEILEDVHDSYTDRSYFHCLLGIIYIYGFGIEKDIDKGEHYLLKSAKKKNIYAKRELAKLYAGKFKINDFNYSDDSIKVNNITIDHNQENRKVNIERVEHDKIRKIKIVHKSNYYNL